MISEYDVNFLRDNAEIVKMSDEITGWEASSRYGESLVATRENIIKALKCAECLWNKIQSIEEEKDKTKSKPFHR